MISAAAATLIKSLVLQKKKTFLSFEVSNKNMNKAKKQDAHSA